MNILVTGAGGFLGKEICKQLREKYPQSKIFGIARNDYPELQEWGVEILRGDLAKDSTYESVLKDVGFKIDTIIHTAAKAGIWGRKSDYWNSNVVATDKLLAWARREKIKRFVYTSTPSVVFEKEAIENGNETLPYAKNPLTHYAASKIVAEQKVLESHASKIFQTLAIRPHLIWGPNDPHLIKRLLKKASGGKLMFVGEGQNLVDVTHVTNAAHAHLLALEYLSEDSERGGKAYFIGQERPIPLGAFLEKVFQVRNLQVQVVGIPLKFAYVLGAIMEGIYFFLSRNWEPPLTRFVALQLGTSHYFSQSQAYVDFAYRPKITMEEGLQSLRVNNI
ncbi:MAG: NAD-dependent epimerase/dehydratase family protein [Bacteriovoracaceae bacterium]|nr:NAD-dependent epimerase/dehydratase family protein [Bacteriovoracaceae bacterium]